MATTTFAGSDTIIRGFFHNDGYYHLGGLVVYFVITFFVSNATYGIAVPSGLFVPCILMGCCFGRFYGEILKYYIFPNLEVPIVPGTYALMGAVGMLGKRERERERERGRAVVVWLVVLLGFHSGSSCTSSCSFA